MKLSPVGVGGCQGFLWLAEGSGQEATSTETDRNQLVMLDIAGKLQLDPALLENRLKYWFDKVGTFRLKIQKVSNPIATATTTKRAVVALALYSLLLKDIAEDIILLLIDGNRVKEEVDLTTIEHALMGIARDSKMRTEARISAVIEGRPFNKSSFLLSSASSVVGNHGVLSSHLISLDNPRVHENVLRDLHSLNQERTRQRTLFVNFGNNSSSALETIPRSSSLETMKASNHRYKFVEDIAKGLNTNGKNTEAIQKAFVKLFASNEEFRPHFREVCPAEGLSLITPLDETTTFALTSSARINVDQVRNLSWGLRSVYGTSIFCPEYKQKRLLGTGFAEPETGVFVKGWTKIPWSVKKVDDILLLRLTYFVRSTGKTNFDHVRDSCVQPSPLLSGGKGKRERKKNNSTLAAPSAKKIGMRSPKRQ